MNYLENINRLGGIRKMYLPNDTTLDDENIQQLAAQVGGTLPENFVEFITSFGI